MSLALLAPLYLGLHLGHGPPEVPGPPEPTEPAATSPDEGDPPPADDPATEVPTQTPTEAGSTQGPTTEEANAPAPVEPCPCDDLDWVCRQEHEAQCTSDAPAPSIKQVEPDDAELPTAPTPAEPEVRGVVLELGAGVGGCRQELCEENPLSFLARAAVGYRWPHVALVANALVGGGPLSEEEEGGLVILGFDAGVELFLATTKRVDPYVGAGLGYMRVIQTGVGTGGIPGEESSTLRFSRPALRVGAGVPVRLGRGWSVGPRFDHTWGFFGSYCSRGSCTPLKEVVENNGEDPVSRRQMRQRFPRPWALTVEFRRRF